MSVNVMNGLHEKCQSVNQASFLECEPAEVFLRGCHTRVSVPVLVNLYPPSSENTVGCIAV